MKGVIFLRKMTLDGRAVGYIYLDSAVVPGEDRKRRVAGKPTALLLRFEQALGIGKGSPFERARL